MTASIDYRIIFKLKAGVLTDHSQSAKDTVPYFKDQLCEELQLQKGSTDFDN